MGMGGMGGYNIPISVSGAPNASALLNAPWFIAFRSPSSTLTSNPYQVAEPTATSAAAEGNAGASTTRGNAAKTSTGLSTPMLLAGAAAIAGIIYYMRKHKKGLA